MKIKIRAYQTTDLKALYRICLLTGKSGKDASGLYGDPDLLGHYYAAPYVFLEPHLCFVLTCNNDPCGYILGTSDSEQFYLRSEKEWFPPLRKKYPMPATDDTTPDARIIRLIHQGHRPKPDLSKYPAHLHIDLLPQAQGKGWGRKLLETFFAALKDRKVSAVHLEVGKSNKGAILFYEKTGFHIIKEYEHSIAFGYYL